MSVTFHWHLLGGEGEVITMIRVFKLSMNYDFGHFLEGGGGIFSNEFSIIFVEIHDHDLWSIFWAPFSNDFSIIFVAIHNHGSGVEYKFSLCYIKLLKHYHCYNWSHWSKAIVTLFHQKLRVLMLGNLVQCRLYFSYISWPEQFFVLW